MPRCFLLAAAVLCCTKVEGNDAMVTVQLRSGRTFTGTLDARTDAEQLWLRWQVGRVQLQRPIIWDAIQSARVDDEPIELARLQELVSHMGTVAPELPPATTISQPPKAIREQPRSVATIRCDAWLANWDADAEFDGLLLEIAALDHHGDELEVEGTVAAELIALDYQPSYLNRGVTGQATTTLGRWAQPWQKQRRYVQLEFQSNPQRDLSVSRYALLKVRLTVPGHGAFEQEIDGVRTRSFSPVGSMIR